MRTMAWRGWLIATGAFAAACGFGVGCGGDDSTTIGTDDAGSDVTSSNDGGSDTTQGNEAGTDSGSDGNPADGRSDTAAVDSSTDTGTTEAGGDASDAAVACSPANSACTGGGVTNGLCKTSLCTACTDPSDDTLCSMAYSDGGSTGYICKVSSCVPGNCHTSSTCAGKVCLSNSCTSCTTDTQCKNDAQYGANFVCNTTTGTCVSNACTTVNTACTTNSADECCAVGGNNVCVAGNCCSNAQCPGQSPACQTNSCLACDAVANNIYFVDPVNGSDTLGDGSNKAGGATASVCAFKTITKALNIIGANPPTNTKINVIGPATVQAGENFPIVVPVNVTITGVTGAVTVSVPTTANNGFRLRFGSSGLANLIIDGTGNTSTAHGIQVETGTQASTTITGVEVRNFPTEAGIRVGDTAVVTIGAGTNVHNCGSIGSNRPGLHVTGTGQAIITSSTDPIKFHDNSFAGIGVDGAGSIVVTGTPGTGEAGTVLTYSNVGPGVVIAGVPNGGVYPTLSTITGLVSYSNTGDGARFLGGTNVKVRGSNFFQNLVGIGVNQAGSGALPYNDDVSHIDLGTNPTTDPGANVFQSPTTGTLFNANAGLCFTISPNKSQTLSAVGNLWATAAGTASIDCRLVSPGALSKTSTCAAGVDIGGGGQTGNTIAIANCN